MSSQLLNLLTVKTVNKRFTGTIWNNHVEDNIEILQSMSNAQYMPVERIDTVHYHGAFYTYLKDNFQISDPVKQHMVLRANRMRHPQDFDENWTMVCIPSDDIMDKIVTEYATFK